MRFILVACLLVCFSFAADFTPIASCAKGVTIGANNHYYAFFDAQVELANTDVDSTYFDGDATYYHPTRFATTGLHKRAHFFEIFAQVSYWELDGVKAELDAVAHPECS